MSSIPGNFVDIFFDLPLLWYNLPLGKRYAGVWYLGPIGAGRKRVVLKISHLVGTPA